MRKCVAKASLDRSFMMRRYEGVSWDEREVPFS